MRATRALVSIFLIIHVTHALGDVQPKSLISEQEGPSGLSPAKHLTEEEQKGLSSTSRAAADTDNTRNVVVGESQKTQDLPKVSTIQDTPSLDTATGEKAQLNKVTTTSDAPSSKAALSVDALVPSRNDDPIDFVLLWNDYEDAVTLGVLGDVGGAEAVRGVQSKRDNTVETLRVALRSYAQHAPFVRRVHLVTPLASAVPKWVNTDPGMKVNIVPHSTLFGDRVTSDAPVFNNVAIESRIASVPGLAEKFCLFSSDNMVLTGDVSRLDFFTSDGRAKLFLENSRGTEMGGARVEGMTTAMQNANGLLVGLGAHASSATKHGRLDHIVPLLKSTMSSTTTHFAEILSKTARHRLPKQDDVSAVQLALIMGVENNDVVAVHWRDEEFLELRTETESERETAAEFLNKLELGQVSPKLTRVVQPAGLATSSSMVQHEVVGSMDQTTSTMTNLPFSLAGLFYEHSKYER